MKMDALAWVEYYGQEAVKELEAEGIVITTEIMLEVIREATLKTRQMAFRTCYIQDDKEKLREVFILWEHVKHGDMKMCEIYDYISIQTDIPNSTVEKYIAKFRKGENPTQPTFDFEDAA